MSKDAIVINDNTTVSISQFIEIQKQKINPLYVDVWGTESWERNIFIKIIEHLQSLPSKSGWTDEDMMIAYSRGQNDVADASLFHDCTRPLVDATTFISEYRKQKRGE